MNTNFQKNRKMEISHKNLVSGVSLDVEQIIHDSRLYEMNKEDALMDVNVCNETLNNNNSIFVFQNNEDEHCRDRYCYVKTQTILGSNGETKMIIVDKIIIDNNLIDKRIFKTIFSLLFQKEKGDMGDRIVVGNKNERFGDNADSVAIELASYVCELYENYTSEMYPVYHCDVNIPIANMY